MKVPGKGRKRAKNRFMKHIQVVSGSIKMPVRLNETETALLVWKSLPFQGQANLWGDEIYFEIPVKTVQEEPVETVAAGDVGYWPPGNALCLFFGPTPISTASEIRPASAVTVIGRMDGDPEIFHAVGEGDEVAVERIV